MTTVSDLRYFVKKYQDLFNTLLLYIPLLALTDGQNHRQRLKLILVGLGNLQFLQVNPGWAG